MQEIPGLQALTLEIMGVKIKKTNAHFFVQEEDLQEYLEKRKNDRKEKQ